MSLATTASTYNSLEDRLVASGIISEGQLELARREQTRKGGVLRRILLELGFVTPEKLSDFVAVEAHAGVVDLNELAIDKSAVQIVPTDIIRRFKALPVSRTDGALTVAMADPSNIVAIDTLHQITGLDIDVVTTSERDILNFLDDYEARGESIIESIDRIIAEKKDREIVEEIELVEEGEAPVINLVSQIISRAVTKGASDIHFEPEEKLMRIRTRIDGILHQDVLIPRSLQPAVVSRMKILADMDVTENRVPQDGRASVYVQRRQINLRVSTLPTSFGESVVVRILDTGSQILQMSSLGMAPAVERMVRDALEAPHGVIIVTGPTGSGKTTTLYSVLNEITSSELSIFTLEDPVEMRIQGIRQTQIKEEVGLTFGAGLRSLLRQDPDVILVGETRDTETAQLMVRAALTGHLVFSTLHTNDAPSAIPRLIDMGVEPYLLPSSLIGVLAQRLVRRLCPHCRRPVANPEAELAKYNYVPEPGQPVELWEENGCARCHQSGFKGRKAIFEWMPVDESFHQAIVNCQGAPELAKIARSKGMRSMFDDGVRVALNGETTIPEVLRVTRASER